MRSSRPRRAALPAALLAPLLAAAGPAVPEQRQRELRHLLLHDCGSCHGLTMRGGLGRSLLPEALADRSDAALAQTILQGVRGTAMPPWRDELTADEAHWMVRELRKGVAARGE
jgi:mono/diheme cytochrome c family protein